MIKYKDIFEMITSEKNAYEMPINIDGWDWSMKEHLKTSFYYKHGRLLTGNSDDKPVKNIVKPILNLQYRTEDLDVKDIVLYINDENKYHLSFLVKKYHDEVFLKKNNLDTFLDDINISRIDYGGVLLQDIKQPVPRVIDLRSIVFCDQTDIINGPICIKHYYSPDQLKKMEDNGWGSEANGATVTVDEIIVLSEDSKDQENDGVRTHTPGKYIELYETHGTLPNSFMGEDDDGYSRQMHITAFYTDLQGNTNGVTLFKSKVKDEDFKFLARDTIVGRALGFGGVEELFEPQVWTNYSLIRKKDLMDSAAKTIYKTTDATFASRNKVKNMDNMEIAVIEEGKDITQLDTYPRNINIFNESVNEWAVHAQQTGSANDPLMGASPTSGTPFKLQELVTNESRGLHDWRRGQLAKFVEEVYRDWIIPYIIKEITKGDKFLAELDYEEMEYVADLVAKKEANNKLVEKVLNGETIIDGEKEQIIEETKQSFLKSNKKFIEILKDEFKGVPISISINVAGKQKDLSGMVDKLVNVFRQISTNPQILQDPTMMKLFNKILVASGLDPKDFQGFSKVQQSMEVQQTATPQLTQ